MTFGIVGLGRIGGNFALQALEKGRRVVGSNRSPEATRKFAEWGLTAAFSWEELLSSLMPPRTVLALPVP